MQRVDIENIVTNVCDYMGIHRSELGLPCRHPRAVRARELVAFLARRHTLLSYNELAEVMGRPGHTSVRDMHKRFVDRMDDERVLQLKDVCRIMEVEVG